MCVGVFKDVPCEVKISLTKHKVGLSVPALNRLKCFRLVLVQVPLRDRERKRKKK